MDLTHTIFLTQTDTTIGFVSQAPERLTAVKQRPPHKHYIKAVNNLHTLQQFTRIPTQHKNRVRRAQKTTFIIEGDSYRVIHDANHLLLLNRLKWVYTTSANLSNHSYDETFVKRASDIIIEPLLGEKTSSSIYKLYPKTLKKVR